MARPQLSIVINNYNYARFLPEALDNALAQAVAGDEILVVDDGSTDDSAAVLEGYARERGVRVIAQANSGQLPAVRRGLREARGDVAVLLDSDDYFLPGYLERLREIYDRHSQVDHVLAHARPFGDDAVAVRDTTDHLAYMALTDGPTGSTRWAAALFQEYVGVPTSGNSFRLALREPLLELTGLLQAPLPVDEAQARRLGISATEASLPRQSADGAIVRASSLLGANKYYDNTPGFAYRIHASNKYAGSTDRGRAYLRRQRKRQFAALVADREGQALPPTCAEVSAEIRQRSLPQNQRRRLRVRLFYARAMLSCRGGLLAKLGGIVTALCSRGRQAGASS